MKNNGDPETMCFRILFKKMFFGAFKAPLMKKDHGTETMCFSAFIAH
jgi:hypothetical protein